MPEFRGARILPMLAAAILAAALGLRSLARADATLILVDQANPPFMYLTMEKQAAGIYPAILAEAFRRMGQPVAVEAVPWKRALMLMEQNLAGVGGIYKTEERLRKYDYSDVLHVERIVVVQRAGDAFPFQGIHSLRGKRIGALRGWSYGDAFDTARREGLFTVEEVEGDAQNLGKLQAGRIDAMLAVKESAEVVLAASGAREDFVVQAKSLTENPAFLAFAKSAGKKELLEAFNKALDDMRHDGTLSTTVQSVLARR